MVFLLFTGFSGGIFCLIFGDLFVKKEQYQIGLIWLKNGLSTCEMNHTEGETCEALDLLYL